MNVAILGCGPAGLLAAHAAALCGHSVKIYSRRQASPMEGAQYLHVDIPDLPNKPSEIKYMLLGDVEGYKEKVYGSGDPDVVVSPEQYVGSHKCWDLRLAYARLWVRWEAAIIHVTITQQALDNIVQTNDVVISTIPASSLCRHQASDETDHVFQFQPVYIDNLWSGPMTGEDQEIWEDYQNLVICNGLSNDGWYRTSHIYGHSNTEWANNDAIPVNRTIHDGAGLWRVRKPIRTNCDCWPNVIRAGRFGRWTKGVLSHDAFDVAMAQLS